MDSCVWFRKSYRTISTGNQVSYLYRYGACRAKALSLFQHVTVAAFSFFCELRHKARKAATLERQLRSGSRHAKKACQRHASRHPFAPTCADIRHLDRRSSHCCRFDASIVWHWLRSIHVVRSTGCGVYGSMHSTRSVAHESTTQLRTAAPSAPRPHRIGGKPLWSYCRRYVS